MQIWKSSVLIFIILCLAIVSACSSGSNNSHENEPAPPANNGSTEPAGTNAAEVEEEPAINMQGKTLTILQHTDPPTAGTEAGDAQLARIEEVEKKYNVNIEYSIVPWGENVTMITNSGLSGEPVADIVLADLRHAIPLIKQGLLQPVDEFFDFTDPKWPANVAEYGAFRGKTYGFISDIKPGAGIYYNRTLFQREGLPDPHQLVAEDNWTWDTFLDIAKRATKDTDGDGVIDQWGITNHAGFLARLLTYSNNGKLMDEKDGKFVFTHDDPNMLEAFHFLDDLFNTHKVVHPNTNTDGSAYNESQEVFSSGRAAMITGETWEGEGRTGMTDEQGFVPFPKGPQATDYVAGIENYYAYYMPANAKNPKEAAIIWEDMILWDQTENIRREAAERQNVAAEEDVEELLNVSQYLVPLFFPFAGQDQWAAFGVTNRGGTAEAELEAVRPEAQARIDEVLNTD